MRTKSLKSSLSQYDVANAHADNRASTETDGEENVHPIAVGIADAAKLCGLGRTTLYAAMASGELQARKFGRRTLILRIDLERWMWGQPAFRPGPETPKFKAPP